jgi:hypothetical protein
VILWPIIRRLDERNLTVADLELDFHRLIDLKNDLESVVQEFTNADDFSDDVATATGQDDLASEVRSFASGWNNKRQAMLSDVENLQSQIQAITDGFTQVDTGLAKALASDSNAAPATSGPTAAK